MDLARILNTPTIQRQYPSEIEDSEVSEALEAPSEASTQSWDSENGPRPESLSPTFRERFQTSRDVRLMIKTTLLFKVSWRAIRDKLGVTNHQIALAKKQQLTPQHQRRERKPKLSTPHRNRIEQWLQESPSRKYIAYRHIPHELNLEIKYEEKAIRTGFKLLGYGRRITRRKGFSDD